MSASIIAFALGGLFCHQLHHLPDPLFTGLSPLLLPVLFRGTRSLRIPAAFLAGIAWTALAAHQGLAGRLPRDLQGVDFKVSGSVDGVPVHDGDRIRFTLALDGVDGNFGAWDWRGCRVRLTWYRAPREARLHAGERWRVGVRLKVPRGARNRAGFDWEHRALRERTCATGYLVRHPRPVRIDPGGPGLHRLRQHLAARLDAHLADLPAAGLVRALGVGLRDRVQAEHLWLLQSTGTAHLMAISGLHVGLVATAGLALFSVAARFSAPALLLLPRAHWGALGALFAAVGYSALAGFSIPTQRALFMLIAFLLARLARRRCARHRPLVLALGVLLVMDPLAVFDAATWLSFAAVAGLLWALAPGVRSRAPGVVRSLTDLARLQLVASAVMVPMTVLFFSSQSLLSPLANLLAVPVTGFIAVPAILAGLALDLAGLGPGGELLRFAAHVLGTLLQILETLPERDGLLVSAATPSPAAFACALVGVVVLVSLTSPWIRLLGLVWMAPLLLPAGVGPGDGALQLRVLDVGQGLAAVIRTRHRVLVFDAGPAYGNGRDAGAAVVAPALRSSGLGRVDLLLVSHHHADHAGGTPGLARSVLVDRVVGEPGEFIRASTPCHQGMRWRWDGFDFRILHPREPAGRGNDASCVLQVTGAAGSLLLPADIERGAEAELSRRFGADLASTVLVVPHHGSRTSSTSSFLDRVAPRVAINSSGHRNRFRLPAAEVVRRYRERGIALFDTACDGEIAVDLVPGRAPSVRRWRDERMRFWHSRDAGAHCRP